MYEQMTREAAAEARPNREELILEHLAQVRMIASRIHDRLPDSVCLDDLISAGVLGLIDAVDHFDTTLNLKLKTYAEHKIRGAILDSLRSLDWAPRNKRKKAKLIEAAITAQEAKLHRSPTEEEVAKHLEISLEEYRRWLVETRAVNLAPMEQGPTGDSEGSDVLRFISGDDDEWPTKQFERAELKRLVTQTVGRLPDVERTIITLYYGKELTLREIAQVVSLHETRVSQLKTQAILRMRSALRTKWPVTAR